MGFTIVPERRDSGAGTFVYKILPRRFELGDGERVPFVVEFYTPVERYGEEPTPICRFSGLGERVEDGCIRLPKKDFCFDPKEDASLNWFVSIKVVGIAVHRSEARRVGKECVRRGRSLWWSEH